MIFPSSAANLPSPEPMTKDAKTAPKTRSATQRPRKARQADFEKALAQLEKIITALEKGNLPLEEAVKRFEEGMALLKDCRKTLDQAEQKVRILVEKKQEFQTENWIEDFTEDPENREDG